MTGRSKLNGLGASATLCFVAVFERHGRPSLVVLVEGHGNDGQAVCKDSARTALCVYNSLPALFRSESYGMFDIEWTQTKWLSTFRKSGDTPLPSSSKKANSERKLEKLILAEKEFN